jgi:hypothetical protein
MDAKSAVLEPPCLSYRPPSFGNRTVSSDATQFRLVEKIFSIHARNAFRAIQRAGCDICTTQRITGVCLGDRRNICDQISVLCQAAPGLGQPSWKECKPRPLRSALPERLGRFLRIRRDRFSPRCCRLRKLRRKRSNQSAVPAGDCSFPFPHIARSQ